MSDLLHVFAFEHIAVRGAVVQLDATWRHIRNLHVDPPAVESLLGECVVASALLASTLKRGSGSVILQLQGDGPIRLLVAECSGDLGLRCTARYTEPIAAASLARLISRGRCAITVGGASSARRYQGVVPIEDTTLAGVLESYMARSEQLETRILLFAAAEAASGLLLQRIPDGAETDADGWNRVTQLGSTVSADELNTLAAPTLLRRLFPEEDARIFGGRRLQFECSCSPDRVLGMLKSLGREEVESILAEQGKLEVTCEFCGQRYVFPPERCREIYS